MIFENRVDAAKKLAKKLVNLRNENPVIFAIPRGGVVIGDVIAKKLDAKLDIIVSRKIGAPKNRELAIGSVIHDGSFFPNMEIIDTLNVSKEYIEQEIKSEFKEIKRRLMKFRGNTKYEIENKTIILVDDGIATGATISAAIEWVKKQRPKRLILAIPIGSRDAIKRLSKIAEVVVLDAPVFFNAVGEFYNDFEQVKDSQVVEILLRHGYKPK